MTTIYSPSDDTSSQSTLREVVWPDFIDIIGFFLVVFHTEAPERL
jgi:hypothetical protein